MLSRTRGQVFTFGAPDLAVVNTTAFLICLGCRRAGFDPSALKRYIQRKERLMGHPRPMGEDGRHSYKEIIVVTNEDLNTPVTESSTERTSYDTANSSTQT